jgi:TPR repeat protein
MKLPWYHRLNLFSRHTPSASLAVQDESEEQNAKGLDHRMDRKDPESLASALECFQKAANLGHPGAQNNLASMLAGGEGTPRDLAQAQSWLLRAARQGDASAQFNLAAWYHRGNMRGSTAHASQGRVEALMWFLICAAQNYHKADGWCERLRVDMNREEVTEAMRRAAEFTPCKEGAASANGS